MRSIGPARLGALGVAVVAVALVAVIATRPSAQLAEASPLVGRPAPVLAGHALQGGAEVSLQRMRGSYVLVTFFASWCVPCRSEVPALDTVEAGSTKVVAVVFEDQAAAAAKFLASAGARYPAIADPGGRLAMSWGVRDLPTSYLVGPAGKVLAEISGPLTAGEVGHLVALAAVRASR